MTVVPHDPARDKQADLATRWTAVALATSHLAVSRADMAEQLSDVTDTLVGILRAEPLDTAAVEHAGARLVGMNLTGANALEGTIRLLGSELLDAAGVDFDRVSAEKVTALTAALASGYMAALRDRLFDEQEMIKKAVFRARDVAERARRAIEARWHAVFHSTAAGIAITDLDGTVQLVNPALCEILGQPEDRLLDQPLAIRISPAYSPQVLAAFGQVARGEHDKFVGDIVFLGADGEEVWTRLSLSLVRDVTQEPEYAVAVVENISDLHLLRERQLSMTLSDQLTGLPNRTAFMSQLDSALQHAGADDNIALCYIDLDGFKIINDGVDHTTGDRVLKRVATTLKAAFPEPAALVARLGGDGFAVLLTGTNGSFGISERISAALEELAEPIYEDDDTGVAVSASVGIVERPAAGLTSTDLVRAAEITVHRAKRNGKAQWELYDAELDDEYRARFKLGAAIPGALELGQFQVSYQPVRQLSGGTLIGLRSLLHWNHPKRGLLQPQEFMDMAETTGFIVPLGRWMLEQSCRQLGAWHDMLGDAAPVLAISMTARMAREQDLVQIVRDVLDKTGAPARKLRLSVPATAAVDDRGEPLENLRILREIDVGVVVHDFGVGGTALIDLRRLHVEGITISPAVVRVFGERLDESPYEHGMRRIAAMGERRGIRVVADGVTNQAAIDRLCEAGVRFGAGPALGAPMLDAEVTRMLKQEND